MSPATFLTIDVRAGKQALPPPKHANSNSAGDVVPSLFRFLMIVGILAGLVYGGMYALVAFVKPEPREITVRVPLEKLQQ